MVDSNCDLSGESNLMYNHNENHNFELGDLSETEPEHFRITTQRKISLTSELIADSSPMRHALFRHTNCNDLESEIRDDAPSEGQPKMVIENYRNENYGTSESHEMATIEDVDESLANGEQMVRIRKLENVNPSELETNVLRGVLDIVSSLTRRMSDLEGQMRSLKRKIQKTVCTNGKRYGKNKLPLVISNYAQNSNNSGDDHDAVLREREREHGNRHLSDEEERNREVREIREYRMNRFLFKKTPETESLNQRPVRHFEIPIPPKKKTRSTV